MKPITRIEHSLAMALAAVEEPSCPPKLANALRHAVFPGGARIRPKLCLAVDSGYYTRRALFGQQISSARPRARAPAHPFFFLFGAGSSFYRFL
jgi:geranylgeranyl pyrophosphate synthase